MPLCQSITEPIFRDELPVLSHEKRTLRGPLQACFVRRRFLPILSRKRQPIILPNATLAPRIPSERDKSKSRLQAGQYLTLERDIRIFAKNIRSHWSFIAQSTKTRGESKFTKRKSLLSSRTKKLKEVRFPARKGADSRAGSTAKDATCVFLGKSTSIVSLCEA